MGVGCPEYILLFRKLPTDKSTAYADEPVKKTKEEYTRAQWQIDAHGYWRSSGDRLVTKKELLEADIKNLQKSGYEADEKRLTTGVVWKSAVIYAERKMDCKTA